MRFRPGSEREYDYGLDPGERYEPVDDLDEPPFDLSQPHIMTVLGPIRPEEAGVTLAHEHVIAKSPARDATPEPDLVLDDPHAALAELEDLYSAGGRTVVDSTTAADGRDIRSLHWVAARAPVHLVAVTGNHSGALPGRDHDRRTADDIASVCVAELTEGIEGTDIRAGAIVAGTSQERFVPADEVALRGAAQAQRATGAAIVCLSRQGRLANEQLGMIAAAGGDPAKVVLCHQGAQLNVDDLLGPLEKGAWVSFVQVMGSDSASSASVAETIARLVRAGFGQRIMVSAGLDRRSTLRAYGGSPGLVYLVESFPLLLMEAGLSAPEVRLLLVENPAAALTIDRPAAAGSVESSQA